MRAETGPLQVGNDWPGFFFRGDEALGLAQQARWAIETNDIDVMKSLLERIAGDLEACAVNK